MKEEQVAALMHDQESERKKPNGRSEEERRVRELRLATFNKSLRDLYNSQWEHVQLDGLPNDRLVDGKNVTQREPQVVNDLSELLREHFASLFDVYLFYAKVDADEHASELYRMTESSWKTMLRDALVLGAEKYQMVCLTSHQVSQIFKSVNQRRDNLERRQRSAAGASPAGSVTSAVIESVAGGAVGFTSTVVRSHVSAGSLYSFTFSEFLEGLVITALELFPPPQATPADSTPSDAAAPLTAAHTLSAVGTLLEERILGQAKHGHVLDFRRLVLESDMITSTMEGLSSSLDALYARYAKDPKVMGSGPQQHTGAASRNMLSLRRFLDMCQDANLIGPGLSQSAAKACFVHALEITPEGTGVRRPLLTRGGEFHEAVLRLTHAYQHPPPSYTTAMLGGASPGKTNRKTMSKQSSAALAAAAAAEVAKAIPRTTPREMDEEPEEEEKALLAKLPSVCGKLLALTDFAAGSVPVTA